jgi:hypothetical protein
MCEVLLEGGGAHGLFDRLDRLFIGQQAGSL